MDDALDYSAEQARLGKTVGDDFREGKITLPVLTAFHAGDAAEQEFWRRTLEAGEQTDEDFAEAQRLLAKHGGIERTIERAELYGNAALKALEIFPNGEARAALADVVRFCIERAR